MTEALAHLRAAKLGSVAAIAIATLALAAPDANAAPTSARVVATIGTLNFDGGDDTVAITNVGGFLSHGLTGATTTAGESFNSELDWDTLLPGNQTLLAGALSETVLNGGDGRDALTAPQGAGDVSKAILNGEGGNDALTGSRAADDLRGGAGDDRLVGFLRDDDVEGGDGNDTLVWNNGDGSDVMDGDAGNDVVEVDGSPTAADAFTIEPGAPRGRVRFTRTNLGPFTLDIAAERLEVNSLGGDDGMTATGALSSLVLLRLDGGSGADAITGADGPDVILGDEDDDTLAGGAGNDRVVGDGGNDTVNGGAGDNRIAGDSGNDTVNGGSGDDELSWSDGDASDVMNGEDGHDVIEVDGSPTAGDIFTLQPNAARVRLDRTNLGPFGLDIGTSEAMALDSLGGDDTVTVGEVGALGVIVDGGSGNDSLLGSDGAETLLGGSGNDAINPGPGVDAVSGDEGDDAIALRDTTVDIARCGTGTDQVTADGVLLDAVADDCETSNRPPVFDSIFTRPVTFPGGTVKIKNGKGKITLACPAASLINCQGFMVVLTAKGAKVGEVKAVVELARAVFGLGPGALANVRITVPRGAERLATSTGKLKVRVLAITGISPYSASSIGKLTLAFVKPKKRRARST